MKLEKDVRNAIAALLVRIIYAEDVIDVGKFDETKKVIEKYELTAENVDAGRMMTLEESVKILTNNDSIHGEFIEQLLTELSRIAMTDSYCAPSEALLLIGLEYEFYAKGKIISVRDSNLYLDGANAYYVRPSFSEYNGDLSLTEVSDHVFRHFDELSLYFSSFGFDFICIPKIVRDYTTDDRLVELLKYFTSFFSKRKENDVASAMRDFSSFSTAEFSRILFKGRDYDCSSDHPEPGILIRISETLTGGSKLNEFIYIPIISSGISPIINVVRDFFKRFQEVVSHTSYLVTPEMPLRLNHFNLYSSLLQYRIENGFKKSSAVTIDLSKRALFFDSLNVSVKLDAKIYDYLFIAWVSSRFELIKGIKEIAEINNKYISIPYETLYGRVLNLRLSGEEQLSDDEVRRKFKEDLRKHVYFIKERITQEVLGLDYPEDYYPRRVENMPFIYAIGANRFFVMNIDGKTALDQSQICEQLDKDLKKLLDIYHFDIDNHLGMTSFLRWIQK